MLNNGLFLLHQYALLAWLLYLICTGVPGGSVLAVVTKSMAKSSLSHHGLSMDRYRGPSLSRLVAVSRLLYFASSSSEGIDEDVDAASRIPDFHILIMPPCFYSKLSDLDLLETDSALPREVCRPSEGGLKLDCPISMARDSLSTDDLQGSFSGDCV
ncbi:hypothetical protein GE09DRAFT_299169 [Coniochaeta sp. 2T2.1]|nr:hypothetical protein GE09DRAFT_299169 [Coniochaeta sp. 2T2.1]